MSIAITAPTGNIGSSLVEQLLAVDTALTLLVRNPDRLSALVRSRVKVQQGDLLDANFVRRATEDAEALFLLAPPNYAVPNVRDYYRSISDAATEAVRANSLPHVVFISSVGGGSQNAGLVTETYGIEDALNATDASVLSLRCGFFMENLLNYLPTLRDQGAFYSLSRPNLPTPMVATRDIAGVAAQKLRDRNWHGKSYLAVQGAADITLEQAAQIIGDVVGKPIRYVQVPSEQVRQTFLTMGASPDFADSYVQMLEAFERGIYGAEPRTAETTTPTTLQQWTSEVLQLAMR